MSRHLVIGTAGHIDHGKSALVRALTGIDPDRLKEEQSRGITIELGFAHATLSATGDDEQGDVEVAFVDVPGHERFVRTMLAGAGGLDAVLLIVAADESVMPQTREHFEICRLLGIRQGLIVVTKADLADQETVELVSLEARELVAGSQLAAAPIVPVSAHTGEGLDALRAAIRHLATPDKGALPPAGLRPMREGVARLPIDRAFSVKGFGSVVTGTLGTGEIREGDALVLLPPGEIESTGRSVRVRGVQVHGRTTTSVSAPRRVAVNLGGVELADVRRGMTLATPGTLAVTRRVDVCLELLPGARMLRHGQRVRVHQGTAESLATVALSAVRENPADAWTRVEAGAADGVVAPGGEALARLRLAARSVLTRGDRLVLRAVSPAATIGGASVLDPEPPGGGVRRDRAARRLMELQADSSTGWLGIWLREAGLRGMTVDDVVRRGGCGPDVAARLLQDLVEQRIAVPSGVCFVDESAIVEAERRLVDLLKAFHTSRPEESGLPREEVRDRLGAGDVLDTLLARLVREVTGRERLALATHQPRVTDADRRVREALETALQAAALQGPDLGALVSAAGAPESTVQASLRTLQKEGVAHRLDGLWFHASHLNLLKEQVKALGAGAVLDVGMAKTRFGVSRKFAIPLLEFLDRERVTRRTGNHRVVI